MDKADTITVAWLDLARSARDGAVALCDAMPRSAGSRAYYAAFAAAHALLNHLQPSRAWPGRAHLSHGELASELRWALNHFLGGKCNPDVYRQIVEDVYSARRIADYRPLAVFSTADARESVDGCKSLVRLAERVMT